MTDTNLVTALSATAPKVETPAKTPTKPFLVLSHLHHDKQDHAPGDSVQLTEPQAIALAALGVVDAASS
jgi:hypothetical protein